MRLVFSLFALAGLISLAACSTTPEAPVQAVDTPSVEALRALPPGVSTKDIGLQSGCYVYSTADGPVPLTNARGQRICA